MAYCRVFMPFYCLLLFVYTGSFLLKFRVISYWHVYCKRSSTQRQVLHFLGLWLSAEVWMLQLLADRAEESPVPLARLPLPLPSPRPTNKPPPAAVRLRGSNPYVGDTVMVQNECEGRDQCVSWYSDGVGDRGIGGLRHRRGRGGGGEIQGDHKPSVPSST